MKEERKNSKGLEPLSIKDIQQKMFKFRTTATEKR